MHTWEADNKKKMKDTTTTTSTPAIRENHYKLEISDAQDERLCDIFPVLQRS